MLVVVAAPPARLSVAVSGVVSGPPSVQRGPVLFHMGVAAAGPGVSVWVLLRVLLFFFGLRVSAVRVGPFPVCVCVCILPF
jgi:hypothetical protein